MGLNCRGPDFFFAVFGTMVCNGEEETRRCADSILVVESGRFVDLSLLFHPPTGFGFYLRLRFHMDPLHPEPDDPPAAQTQASTQGTNVNTQILGQKAVAENPYIVLKDDPMWKGTVAVNCP